MVGTLLGVCPIVKLSKKSSGCLSAYTLHGNGNTESQGYMHRLPSDQQNHLPSCQDVVIFPFEEKHPKAHQCNDALIVQVIRMKDIIFLDSAQFEELPTLGSHKRGFRTLHPVAFLDESL